MGRLEGLTEDGAWRLEVVGGTLRAARFGWVSRPTAERAARIEELVGRTVPDVEWEAVLVEALLGHPASAQLVALELELTFVDPTLARALTALVSRHRPALTHLGLALRGTDPRRAKPGSPRVSATTAEALVRAVPSLTSLALRGHRLLPQFAHPNLQALRVEGYRALAGCGVAEPGVEHATPALVDLSLALDRQAVDFLSRVELGLGVVPAALRRLDLRGSPGWFDPEARDGRSVAGFLERLSDRGFSANLEWLGLPALRSVDAVHVARWADRLPRLQTVVVDHLDDAARNELQGRVRELRVGERAAVWVDTIEAGTARDRLRDHLDEGFDTVRALIAACGNDRSALRELRDTLPAAWRAPVVSALAEGPTSAPGDLPAGAEARLGRPRDVPSPLDVPWPKVHQAGARGGSTTVTRPELARYAAGSPAAPVAFSGDDWLVVGHEDGSVSVRDARAGRQMAVFRGHGGPVVAVAASVDGRYAASVDRPDRGRSRTLVLDLRRLEVAAILEGEDAPGPRSEIRFSHGRLEARWGPSLSAWDPATGARLRALDRLRRVERLAVAPDGRRVATAPDVTVWDLGVSEPLRRLGRSHRAPGAVAFAPHGGWLAAVVGRRPTLFSADGRVAGVLDQPDCLDLAFSGARLLVASPHAVASYDVPSLEFRWSTDVPVRPARLASDEQRIVAGAYADQIAVLEASHGALVGQTTSQEPGPTLHALALGPDGAPVATTGGERRGRSWRFDKDGTRAARLTDRAGRDVGGVAMAWSADGARVAFARPGATTIEVYQPCRDGLHLIRTLSASSGHEITDLAYDTFGRLLSAGRDHTVLVWSRA